MKQFSEHDADILVITFFYLFFKFQRRNCIQPGWKTAEQPLLFQSVQSEWDLIKLGLDMERLANWDFEGSTSRFVCDYLKNHQSRLAFLDTRTNEVITETIHRASYYTSNQIEMSQAEGDDFYEGFANASEFALVRTPFICSLFGVEDKWPFDSITEFESLSEFAGQIIMSRITID